MADNKPSKPKAPEVVAPVIAEAPSEPRNLTREMLIDMLGEEEARKRIP
jgi:hypothetical protein